MFRESCGKCHFCNTKRPSDITLADFWGWENSVPNMNEDDKGISLLLVNTPKGKEILEAIKEKMDIEEVKLENSLQPNLRKPSPIHNCHDAFKKEYKKYGFKYIYYRYGDIGPIYFIRKIKQSIRKFFKF